MSAISTTLFLAGKRWLAGRNAGKKRFEDAMKCLS